MKTSGYYEQEYASKREVIDIATEIVTEIVNNADEIEGKVLTFANLPLASSQTDKIWLVEQSSGVWLVNYKQAGLYKSDGTIWNLLDSTSDIINTLNNKADKLTTITTGNGLAGGGDLSANRTISHSDTSTQANVVNTNGNVIQSANLDDFGHITSFSSIDLDNRYVLSGGAYANPTWITSLDANKLTGTIPSNVLGASTVYIGTTAIALNRASGNQALTGINSIQYVGATSGTATLQAPAVAGTTTFTLPSTSGNLIGSGDTATVTNTMLAGSIADSKLNTITTVGKVANSSTTAVSTNTASTIVLRDASGNFSAGTITGALSGNSTTATTLQTARTINGTSFDGSANITITANTTNALTISSPLTGTSFNGSSAVSIGIQTASSTLSGALSSTDWSTFNNKQSTISLTTTGNSGASSFVSNVLNIPNYTLSGLGGQPALNGTGFVKISGTTISYDNSTYLTGNQTITLSGDITGSGTTAITTTLANSGATAGTYQTATTINPLTIDSKGRITSTGTAVTIAPLFSSIASKPTTISGYGITDGATLTGTQTLTNKTFTDNTTFFQDDLDNTKKAQFQLSSIATATTRTYTLPNNDGVLITNGDTGTVTNTMLAGSIADSKLNTITTAGKVANSATTATNLNTASSIVARDASGNFSAGTITGALSGNSTTATTLQTARTINGTSFDGSANITITANTPNALTIQSPLSGGSFNGSSAISIGLSDSGVVAGTYQNATTITPLTIDAKGRVTSVGTPATITPAFSSITGKPTTITGYGITDGVTLTGTETLTNKSLSDSTTFIINSIDTTKKATFDAANITTATTRTYNLPNVNGTLITTGDTGTVSNTMLAGSIADTKLNTISTAGKIANSATTATNTNTSNAIVSRDASGNFSAGNITANLSGNATTSTALQTARTINGVSFDGTANITVADSTKLPLTGGTVSGNLTLTGSFSTGDFLGGTTAYFGAGKVRIGGGLDNGANTVFSLAPGVVEFDAPGVVGGRLIINSSGNVLIGNPSNTTSKLSVNGVGNFAGSLSVNDVIYEGASAITTLNTTSTLTIAQLLTLVIQSTPTAAITFTLPTGTLTDAGILSSALETNRSFTWSVVNLAGFTITMAGNTGNTYVGNITIGSNTSASFRTIKTAVNTFTTVRI